MNALFTRITTKMGYRYVAFMLVLYGFIFVFQTTSVTLTVDSLGYIIAVDGVSCIPTYSASMIEDAGEIIYEKD